VVYPNTLTGRGAKSARSPLDTLLALLANLEEGEKVTYEVGQGQKGPQAENVSKA
jgi:hypothetical protein